MRTTMDLPDDLFRKAKSLAALRGVSLKELFIEILGEGLHSSPRVTAYGRKDPLPTIIPATGRVIPLLTNAQIFEALETDEDRSA